MVYFIGNSEFIKIGYSDSPLARIEEIYQSLPFKVEIFAIVKGTDTKEKYLQVKFCHLHANREWFKNNGEIIKYIEDEEENLYNHETKKLKRKFFGYLKKIRLEAGYTLYSLGRKMDVCPTWIDNVERLYEVDSIGVRRLKKYLSAIGYEMIIQKKDEEKKGL